ncbi:MAG: bifunctional diaminohydroxyphosphoribosylaminopyrimidine deaminase/5-amino-6-(5-phosphoribosylamino)uracil reductase RibD [Thermoleophilia bacterium]|nr:bifunctional diaminohydroxyphosphoribosylaminopyrimidine deaminase/5-amino-6-(5-phosphoribosylamino)uracil reductase RibD [Thermoleophilia bacterium]MDH3724978.1 bifunctional diaminohydroxyphosphoribosylaminopyrimidine deaminase/5-amino-6-(5-phosphoribosylamino)uracil reductase RibD [Thermoleophilia bacterium]
MSPRPTPAESELLAQARRLARRAEGHVSPNPLVGAVVVRDGEVVGEGWHAGPGQPHAEVAALAGVADPRGTTVVCTLEPCSHHGRTPPCTSALLEAGVVRVVIGALDPLERGRSQGVEVLRQAGVEVAVADGEDERACRELNSAFITWALTGRPEVTLKLATSLDGKIATAGGESQWITGPGSRRRVHRMRAASDAVGVGIGTALADDPQLTAREIEGKVRQPARVVFDSQARLPLDGRLAATAERTPVLVIAGAEAPEERIAALVARGVDVSVLPGSAADRVRGALDLMGERELQSVLIEGGAGLAAVMLHAEVIDRVTWMLAPMVIGGTGAPGAVADPGSATLVGAPRIGEIAVERIDDDVAISGRLRPLAMPGGD